ncbi:type II secretion system protein N [Sulfitobacter sp.]|uniref:type II secretion system protein N n=1 Tax=Sulfitobacter sp. TaxID=1903071 RepID=UPI003561B4BD
MIGLSLVALLFFGGTVLMNLPTTTMARITGVPPQVRALSGSLWSGRAVLDGGLVLNWQGKWTSLLRGQIGADLTLTGPRTLLQGYGFASPWQIGLSDISGRGGADLLVLVPGASPCDGQAVVDIARATWSRARVTSNGRVQISDSLCQVPGQAALETPPLDLVLTSEGTDGVATLTTNNAVKSEMGQARLGPDGWIKLRIEPAAAQLIPGLPDSAPTLLEFQLN